MAVPTFTSCTPATGHPSGRYLLTLVGTDFTVPPAPAATGVATGPTETVQITINGRLATDVRVYSSALITCLCPQFKGEPSDLSHSPGYACDIVISNVGPPVESVTETDGFAYQRPDFTRTEGVLRNVVRTLVLDLRRQVIENVQTSRQVDYDAATGDGLDIVELAGVPGIGLYGPDMQPDNTRRHVARRPSSSLATFEYTRYQAPVYKRLAFEATLHAENLEEYLALATEFVLFFKNNLDLEVLSDDQDPTSDYVDIPMFLTSDPSRAGVADESSTITGVASFELHGVEIDADDRVPVRWGRVLQDLDTDLEIQGEAL